MYLSEADLSIIVLVHSLDHLLEGEVRLGLPQFLHHQFQLHKVNEMASIDVIPTTGERYGMKIPVGDSIVCGYILGCVG